MRLLGRFDPQLPRDVWLLQAGGVVNSFGNGVVLPFLVIYFHDVRGVGLGTTGLAIRRRVRGAAARPASQSGLSSTVSVRVRRSQQASCCRRSTTGCCRSRASPGRASPRWWSKRRLGVLLAEQVDTRLRADAGHPTPRRFRAAAADDGPRPRRRRPHCTRARPAFIHGALHARCAHLIACVFVLGLVRAPVVQRDEAAAPATYAAVARRKTFVGLWTLNFLFGMAGYSLFALLPQFARPLSRRRA